MELNVFTDNDEFLCFFLCFPFQRRSVINNTFMLRYKIVYYDQVVFSSVCVLLIFTKNIDVFHLFFLNVQVRV